MSKNLPGNTPLYVLAFLLVVSAGWTPAGAQPATIGMVVDGSVDAIGASISPVQVHVFDADTREVLGSLTLPGLGGASGDCSISPDGSTGYVSQGDNTLQVVNLTTPPTFGTAISVDTTASFDTSLSADGKFLVVCDGAVGTPPVSVVETATGLQASSLQLSDGLSDISCNSVAVCDNNDVLVTSGQTGEVRRLTLDEFGGLTDTGDVLPTGFLGLEGPQDILCGTGGTTGVVVLRKENVSPAQAEFFSFTTNPLTAVDSRTLTGRGVIFNPDPSPAPAIAGRASAIDPAGDTVYVRSMIDINSCLFPTTGDPLFEVCGLVEVYDYDSATAALSAAPLLKIGPVVVETAAFGVDSIAVHPDDSKLFVSEHTGFGPETVAVVKVYNTADGTLIGPLSDTANGVAPSAAILAPTGVCVGTVGGSADVEFAAFDGNVSISLIEGADNDEVALNTTFTPGAGDGIDPENEDVTIEVAGVSVTIPGGSFTLKTTPRRQFLRFAGFIGIVSVDLKIDVLAGGDYTFKGSLSNVNLDGVTNPVTIKLTIGDDTGSFDATAGIN